MCAALLKQPNALAVQWCLQSAAQTLVKMPAGRASGAEIHCLGHQVSPPFPTRPQSHPISPVVLTLVTSCSSCYCLGTSAGAFCRVLLYNKLTLSAALSCALSYSPSAVLPSKETCQGVLGLLLQRQEVAHIVEQLSRYIASLPTALIGSGLLHLGTAVLQLLL